MTTVVVTGFGPFGEHKINASWEAVKLLRLYKIENVNIVTEEIPVTYEDVDEKIPNLWHRHNPKLVIHVGVSGLTSEIQIEIQAHRAGYEKLDCQNNGHPTKEVCCSSDGEDCIQTKLDVQKLCEEVCKVVKTKVCSSTDAGRYLCEYIYYSSLKIDCTRTLFVHVPILDNPYSAQQLALALRQIIIESLKQLT